MFLKLKYFCQYYYRQIFILFCALLIGGMLFIPKVYSEVGYVVPCGEYEHYFTNGWFIKGALSFVNNLIEPVSASEYLYFNITNNDVIIGKPGAVNSFTIPNFGLVVKDINTILSTLAMVLTSLTFSIGLFNAAIQQQNQQDMLIRRIILLIVAMVCITFSYDIMTNVSTIGNFAVEVTEEKLSLANAGVDDMGNHSGLIETANDLKAQIIEDCYADGELGYYIDLDTGKKSTNVVHSISNLMSSILANVQACAWMVRLSPIAIARFVASFQAMVTCIGRALTILILIATSPLAFCDITSGSNTGIDNIMKVVRRLMVLFIQGVVIFFALSFCNIAMLSVLNAHSSQVLENLTLFVALFFTSAGICSKSQTIAQEIMP